MSHNKLPPITTTTGLYREAAQIVQNAANVWSWTHRTTTPFGIRLPGKVSVIVGDDRFIVPRYLLEDWPVFNTLGDAIETNHATKAFPYVLTWMKLRLMLKLHSALVELDSKLCSLRRFLHGILYVIIQQYAEEPSDSVFRPRGSSAGAFLNVDILLDDVLEQFQKAFGLGFHPFMQYVLSCDPTRHLVCSSVDLSLPRIGSNAKLERVVDAIYLAFLVKLHPSVRVQDVLTDFESFQLPLPDHIPLVGYQTILDWIHARSHVTRRKLLKAAQKQAVELVVACELGMIDTDKSWAQVFECLCHLTSHWNSFPQALRERVLANTPLYFDLKPDEQHKIQCFASLNRDEPLLSQYDVDGIKESEQHRLKNLEEHKNYNTRHCLLPSIVAPPSLQDKLPLYFYEQNDRLKTLGRGQEGTSGKGAEYMGPEHYDPRPPFKVPLVTGPYTWDPDVGRFRSQGVFSKSGNLGFE